MSGDIIFLVPPGQIRCYITGLLRRDTPEENIRQRWARSLIEEYGYSKENIAIEFTITMGTARKRADIVVFKPHTNRTQDDILIIVEAKREDVKPTDKARGEDQLKSYMAACSACRFGLWVGKEFLAFEKPAGGGQPEPVSDIPREGHDRPRRPERRDLREVHDLTSTFRRCHNYIHANGGHQKAEAFHEMLKLIFCKMYDEDEGLDVELQFAVDPREQKSIGGQRRLLEERIQPLFAKVKHRYPYIFAEEEVLKLEPAVLAYIVGELQFISLTSTKADVKGAAYEELVGENLRGDRGEYFTPRNVCDMTVKMIQSIFRKEQLTSLTVIDCCCGTGGFIVSWIDNLREYLFEQETIRQTAMVSSRVRDRVREACARYLFGLDINPFLVRTAQMNLVMHGDGSTNVYRVDSTRSPGEWSEQARQSVPYGKADVVITNPPFGSEVKVDDSHVLSNYELATWDMPKPRSAMPAEQLFVETALKLLRPGGILGIVLPDGILNNPGLRFLRSWLLQRSWIIASVDLPKETFSRTGGVNNPSVLIVKKFTEEEVRLAAAGVIDSSRKVFMAAPKTSGIDKRGKPIFRRHPDGREILDAEGFKTLDDEVTQVTSAFEQWLTANQPV